MKPNEGEETQREVEEELARRGSSPSVNDIGKFIFCTFDRNYFNLL